MNIASKRLVKNLLKQRGLHPQKRLGQNFLTDKGIVRKIIESAEISSQDAVLEIGPGMGVLTQELAKKAKRVVAVEKDRGMAGILKETLKDYQNVDIVRGDILGIGNWKLEIGNSYKVVGNLPFYLTAPVIRQFIESMEVQPQYMVLVVQKEVAQRICPAYKQAGAAPQRMNLMAVSVQIYAKPEIVSYISKKSFWPSPKVDAAIIKITPREPRTDINTSLFFKIVKAGFSQPRKQLANNLSKALGADKTKIKNWLEKNNIQPSQRAQTLAIKDWINLCKTINIL